MRLFPVLIAAQLLALLGAPINATAPDESPGAQPALVAERSVLAVLIHKGGVASGLAHDHLVTAPLAALDLKLDSAAPEATRATLKLAVEKLEIDHFAARAKWKGRLKELGVGPDKLDPIADSDRGKIREAMLGKSQLDAAGFPEISAELLGLRRAEGVAKPFTGYAKLRLTIHGKTVEREIPARWSAEGGVAEAEALGEFKFTEFSIKPYSAALGAVKNQDGFHLYVALATKGN